MHLNSFTIIFLVIFHHCSLSWTFITIQKSISKLKPSIENLNFQKQENDNNNKPSMWQSVKGFFRSKFLKSNIPKTDPSSNRYHLRLIHSPFSGNISNVSSLIQVQMMISLFIGSRRHEVTRILRYLPDITWDTADDIVMNSRREGKSLVRVFGSLNDAEYIARMLKAAEPPVQVELYDSKNDTIL